MEFLTGLTVLFVMCIASLFVFYFFHALYWSLPFEKQSAVYDFITITQWLMFLIGLIYLANWLGTIILN